MGYMGDYGVFEGAPTRVRQTSHVCYKIVSEGGLEPPRPAHLLETGMHALTVGPVVAAVKVARRDGAVLFGRLPGYRARPQTSTNVDAACAVRERTFGVSGLAVK
jgi:hypothetical protein